MKRTATTAPARRETNHARMTPDGFHPGEAMARELRFAPASYDSSARTVVVPTATTRAPRARQSAIAWCVAVGTSKRS